MVQSAQIIEAVQPDLIDINYGCPVKKVANKGAGAGILRDIPKMVEIRLIFNVIHKPTVIRPGFQPPIYSASVSPGEVKSPSSK